MASSLLTNLEAYWKLDESSGNAADSSGNARSLTNTNTVGYAPALIANGADFGTVNGTNKILINTTGCGITGAGDMSYSFWVKIRTEIASGTLIMFVNQTNGQVYHQIDYDFNAGTRRIQWNVGGTNVNFNVTLGTTLFHHIVVTKTGGSAMQVYLDGVLVASGVPAGGTAGSTYNCIGASSGASNGSAMYADEAGLWSRVLTGAEVLTLYNGGLGLTYPFNSNNSGFFNMMRK